MATEALYVPQHSVRFVTATALFDGHDAAINIMRRLLQAQGAEVVHLGHNRSVEEVVTAVIQEDVQGVAVSSYQGGDELAHHPRGNRHQLILIGVKSHEPEPEREPGHRVARHGAGAAVA